MKSRLLAPSLALVLLSVLPALGRTDPVAVSLRPAPAIAPTAWVNGTPAAGIARPGKVTVVLFWKKALSE